MKLHILLGPNCGFSASDISDLRHDEMDLRQGVLVRKRGMTSRHPSVPTAAFRLWPETAALLKEHKSDHPVHALRTKSGGPWVDRETRNSDHVRANWRHLMRYTGIEKPFKLLRKTGASLLESHPLYGRVVGLYLGHAPETIAEKHYARPAQEILGEALGWLRTQLLEDRPGVVVVGQASPEIEGEA